MAALEGEVPVNFKNDMRGGWIGMSKKQQKRGFFKEFSQKMAEANMKSGIHQNTAPYICYITLFCPLKVASGNCWPSSDVYLREMEKNNHPKQSFLLLPHRSISV